MNETCLLSHGHSEVSALLITVWKVNKEKSRVTLNDVKDDYAKRLTIVRGEIKECLTARRAEYLLPYHPTQKPNCVVKA